MFGNNELRKITMCTSIFHHLIHQLLPRFSSPESLFQRFTYLLFFQNCFSGIMVIMLGCAGSISTLRAQGFLLLSLVVTIVNLVNLVILEVGEWRGFLSSEDRDFIKENQLEALMYSAYLCTTISTVLAMIVSFLASQHAFCFQQLLAEKEASMANKNRSSASGNIVHHHNFHQEDDDSLMPKVGIIQHFRGFGNSD